jgi:drug/metabolite transporter (DMT)-like permease
VTSSFASAKNNFRQRDDIHVLAALTAVFAWGIGPIFNKTMTVDASAIVFYRILVGAPLMFAMALLTGGGVSIELMKRTALPGVLFAFSMITGFASVVMTSIANATLITTLQPVLVLLIAPKMFGEKLRLRQLLYSACALVGVLLVVLAAASTSGAHLSGDLLAVANVCIWTGYFVLSKKRRLAGVHSWSYLAAVFLWSAAVVLPYGMIFSNDLGNMSNADWGRILAMAIGPGIVGHGLMTWAQSHVDVTLASLLGLLSPVISTGLAWMILDQNLTTWQTVGAIGVLISLAFLVREQRTPTWGFTRARGLRPRCSQRPSR